MPAGVLPHGNMTPRDSSFKSKEVWGEIGGQEIGLNESTVKFNSCLNCQKCSNNLNTLALVLKLPRLND